MANLGSYIGGQTHADFFKSLHESAKSACGKNFTDFLQTFFHEMQTVCRFFADFFSGSTALMHTFCRLFAHFLQQMIQAADFMHTYSVFADFLQDICTLFSENKIPFCRLHAHLF